MTTETKEATEECDRCFKKFPFGSLARDSVDAALLFCASCQDVNIRECAYCRYSTVPPVSSPAVPGWQFGSTPDSCWNPACESCIASQKLHRRIDTDRMSARKALRMLAKQLEQEGLADEGLYIHDYDEATAVLDKPFQGWRWVPCYVITGSNEGHYVHIDVLRKLFSSHEEETHLLASIKTFSGRRRGYEIALRCAELLGA